LRLTIENCSLNSGGRSSINYDTSSTMTGSTTIRNCTIGGADVRLRWAHNVTIDRCVLSGVNLTLSGTDGNTIRDCRITGGEIQLLSAYTTVISNVTALRSPYSGLLVDGTNNLLVTGLAVYDSAAGVRLSDVYRNVTIADSIIARVDGDGLLVDNSEQLTLVNTSLIDCATGVRLLAGSGNNTFYLNRFSSAINALQVNTSNKWNSYGPMAYQYGGHTYAGNLGNQWNNYPGSDANGDGIGDTPYFSSTIRDNYPLVSRSAISFQDNGPAIISVSWGFNGQNDFKVSDSIRVDLDRDIVGSALQGVSIKDSGNRQVPCDIGYRKYFYGNQWDYYLYFEPQSDLAYGQTYTMTISGLIDVTGRRMSTPYVVSFTTETNAFQVLKVSPLDGASEWPSGWGEFVYNPIMVTFNRPLEDISNDDITAGKIRLLDESLTPVEITAYGSNSAFLDIRPKWNLKNATVYTIRINGIRDNSGNVLPGVFESRFVTWGNPEIVATLPGDRATDVPVNQPVFAYFDRTLNPGSLSSIVIKDSNGNKVSTTVGYIPAGSGLGDGSVSSVVIGHNNFSYSADYTIEVTGVADASGNTMKYVTRKTFRTTDRPYIGSVSPAGAAIDVPRAATITATFSKNMDPASLQGGFTVRDSSGNNVAGTVTYDTTARTATFRPAALLGYGSLYSAHVTGARDNAGNSITAYSWGFTTIRAPISVVSVTPPGGSTDQPTSILITAVFSDEMDDWTVINGFSVKEFYGSAVQGTVSYDTATRKATFRPSVDLKANGNLYRVTLSGMVGTHSGTMPDYTWDFRTLWRKPTVVSTSPSQGASGVSINSAVTVTFSEDMDSEKARTGFKLRNAMNNNVAGGVVTSGRTVTFTPAAPLNEGELYTVYLLGLTGVQQNAMPDYVFEFRVIHKIEPIPTSDLQGTPRPSLIPTATPTPFQTTINGLGITVSGDGITAPAGTDMSRFLTNGHVTLPAGSGKLTVDIDVGSPPNTGTITGVHVSDQSSGTSNSGPATVSVTADLVGLPSGSVTFSATVSDPTPDDIRAAREWTGSRSRTLVNALALIDVEKSGFTNDDLVGGTAKITLTVKKPANFSRTKTYTVIRHGADGYEELTATYKSETADTVTFEILSPNGFSTFLLAETVAATPTPAVTPPVSPTPVPGPAFLLTGLAVMAGVMIMVRVRKK
ncbi:MAG TPA: Ig-like domain-containing protein, partial [Methanocella sp.]